MNKRVLLYCLVLTLVLSSCPMPVFAQELSSPEFVILDADRHRQVEALFELRASLTCDFEANADQIAQIDMQLEELGVEEIAHDEFLGTTTENAGTRATPVTQEYVKHYIERVVTVYNGEQYEIQIITSFPTSSKSVLMPSYSFYVETDSMKAADNIELCTTVVSGLIGGYSDKITNEFFSEAITSLTRAFTLYDVYSAYTDAVSPTTVVDGVECVGLISTAIHEKHFYVKSYGAADTTQILACISNRVSYSATVLSEGELVVNGVAQPDVDDVDFIGTYYSELYGDVDNDFNGKPEITEGRDDVLEWVAKVFWEYRKYGRTDFLLDHRIRKLEFIWAGGNTVTCRIPYNGLGLI